MQDANITFKNDKEAQVAAAQFSSLSKDPAWKRIHDFMQNKIAYIDFQLREGDIKNLDELERLRDKRNMAEQFMNLPDIIVEFVKRSGGQDLEFDPYRGKLPVSEGNDPDPYAK